ncbi:histidine phosphatase family protein [Microvirga brassicacearum]|uniref:Histidine phosphatase family protein n=1 Tax=Microvirga brassicacearum TaxID=2580413 RepID=A0A5N3PAP6_9HYPH|nr:histidine phosphatase family protein [Microvirga brassicacearum]KAB0266751.1 histidine phosphatase family protein [Microvirga brassicacearum]
MWRYLLCTILGLLASAATVAPTTADEAAAWAALREGGHVALMRHAEAPGGAGDPPGFRLDDCSTQRNLSAKGRGDAKTMGEKFRAAGVAVGKLLSSPWCRCVDTARLISVGPVEIAPTFANAYVLADQRSVLAAGAKAVVTSWEGPKTLLVVTHGANIQALVGRNPESGEVVVVAVEGETIREIGRIPAP